MISINNDFSHLSSAAKALRCYTRPKYLAMLNAYCGGGVPVAPLRAQDGEEKDWFVVSNGAFVRDAGYEDTSILGRLPPDRRHADELDGIRLGLFNASREQAFMGMPGIFGNLIGRYLVAGQR